MKKQNEEKKEVIINMKKITCSFIKDKKLLGFTLAEVLITLTIIGVVAALTIPSLLANVNDKTYEAKRKGLETRLAQAIAQMDNLTSYVAKPPEGATESASTYAVNYSSMNFVTEGLSKVFKITNVCEFDNFAACDFPDRVGYSYNSAYKVTTKSRKTLANFSALGNAENLGGTATNAVAFRTKNGESIMLYYNPYCMAEQSVSDGGSKIWVKEVCALLVVDLDGAKKGTNTLGKDVHLGTILYPDTPYVSIPYTQFHQAAGYKRPSYDANYNNTVEYFCSVYVRAGYQKGSMRLPKLTELYNFALYGFIGNGDIWSSQVEGSTGDDYGWMFNYNQVKLVPRSALSGSIWCQPIEGRL